MKKILIVFFCENCGKRKELEAEVEKSLEEMVVDEGWCFVRFRNREFLLCDKCSNALLGEVIKNA